jgi:hypothetical protein
VCYFSVPELPGRFYLRQNLDGHYVTGPGTRSKKLREMRVGRWTQDGRSLRLAATLVFRDKTERDVVLGMDAKRSDRLPNGAATRFPPGWRSSGAARPARARQTLEDATALVQELLKDGAWVSTEELHVRLRGKVSIPMFGRVKTALSIERRRVEVGDRAVYQWRLPSA